MSTTINSMRMLNNRKYSLEALIRGPDSLGGIMERKFGIRAIPSPSYPKPGVSKYFRGGFTIQTHGSYYPSNYNVNAIQIEFPKINRLSTKYKVAALNVSACLFDYYHLHLLDTRL